MTGLDNDYEGSNVYNQNKSWHTDAQDAPVDTANTLFYPKRTQPKQQAPKVETKEGDNAAVTTGEGDVHDYKKRWAELKNHHDKTVRELREQLGTKTSGEGATIPTTPPKTKEELEQLRKSNPAAFEAMKSIAQLIVSEETAAVKSQLSEIERRELKLQRERALSEIVEVHPDFEQLRNDDEFHMWAEKQPKEIQDWIYNNPTNGGLAVRAINLFKMDVGRTKSKESSSTKASARNTQNGADSLVSTKTSSAGVSPEQKVWSRAEIKRLSMDDYDRFEKEIDKAIREGRVVN